MDNMESLNTVYGAAEFAGDFNNLVQFLRSQGVLADRFVCPSCGKEMSSTYRKDSKDGIIWVCGKRSRHSSKNNIRRSIRLGSWFERAKLSLRDVFLLTYLWVVETSQKDLDKFIPNLSGHTKVDWYNFCREVCVVTLCKRDNVIGGQGHIVEIDESKFGRRKYNRGKKVDGQWVFGGIDRETKECFLVAVNDRSKDTLLSIIKDRIHPGTTIYSDCWKAYDCLESEGYRHLTVNHSITFKDPVTGCHTNTIESMWRSVKEKLPSRNRQKDTYDSYLSEFVYRRWRFQNKSYAEKFLLFLEDIKSTYPPWTEQPPNDA